MIEVELMWPDRRLSPNSREHWGRKSRLNQKANRDSYYMALQIIRSRPKPVFDERIPISVDFYPPDNRKRDLDNAFGALKSSIDGVARALEVDDCRFVWRLERHDPVKHGKVILKIEERKENE